MKLDKVLYTARVHTSGGREGGTSRSDDGRLEVAVTPPGAQGSGTNPEQLFAAGWSTCFLSAIKLAAAKRRVALPDGLAVEAEVDLGTAAGGYGLAARLNVRLPGVDRATAEALIETAHQTCPYSRATRGNVDVVSELV